MDDPATDIPLVVQLITASDTPEVQQAAIGKFFSSDAGFNHFLCRVEPAPQSRDIILGIYQWYRELSPILYSKVDSHSYDRDSNMVYVNVTQVFHLFFSPFKGVPSHFMVRLHLKETDGKHYIVQQDGFFMPEDVASMFFPPMAFGIKLAKYSVSMTCNAGTWAFQRLGWWKTQYGPLHKE